jgi:hypothetical protein
MGHAQLCCIRRYFKLLAESGEVQRVLFGGRSFAIAELILNSAAMASPREVVINEIRIHSQYLDDALSAILHTVLFVRAPNVVKPKDRICQNLSPLIYSTCGTKEVDKIIA